MKYLNLRLVLLLGALCSCSSKDKSRSPVDYGVTVKWVSEGATSSYRTIEVYIDTGNEIVRPDIIFGGIEDPELDFDDVDGDGVRDIIFGDHNTKQIVAYKPKTGKFVIIRDDMKGHLYDPN